MLNNQESTYDFVIKSYESDFQGKMSLSAFFLFLQECAWENAKKNGFGYEFVEKEGALWVLSKVKIKMQEFPKWKEHIKIRTWPRGPEGLFALRDYQLLLEGVVIGAVSSYWLILDKKTKRPRRITDFDFSKNDFLKESALEEPLAKIKGSHDLQLIDGRKVYASDLDVNGHVNNATYVRWIYDAFSNESARNLVEFEIHFLGELMLDDEFNIYFEEQHGQAYYKIVNLENKDICKALVTF